MELKQQSQFPSPIKTKNFKNKRIPSELLFDIFKTINTYLYGLPIDLIVNDEDNNDTKIIKMKQWWSKYSTNIMTSSSIIYLVAGKAFKNCKNLFPLQMAASSSNNCENCKVLQLKLEEQGKLIAELEQKLKEQDKKIEEQDKKIKELLCHVCCTYPVEGTCHGSNYPSCQACRRFFSRNVEKGTTSCVNNNDTCANDGDILKCPKCRLAKCIDIGMKVSSNNNVNTTTSTNNLATMATNFGNNFMANQVTTFVTVPAATLQQFQYAQIQHQPSIAQAQQPIYHQQMPTYGISQSPSVQPQQQIVQQTTLPATIHQQQQHGFQQQQQVAGFYATANLSATYALNWQAATANNFGNNFMTNQVATFVPITAATLQQFQYAQLQHQPPIPHQPPPSHTISRSSSVQPQQQHVQQQTNLQAVTVHQPQQQHGFQQQQMTGFYAATAAATNLSAYAQPLIQQTPYQPYFIAQNTSAAVPPHVTIPPPPMTHSIAYDSTHQIPPPGVFVNVPTQQGLNNGNMYSGAATVGHSQQNFQQQH